MPRQGLTTARLVEAAMAMADEIGFAELTLSALARQVDVRVASLYAHIASAEDLKTRVALAALDRLAERATEAVAGRAGKDALVAIADAHREFAAAHPGLFMATRHPLGPGEAADSGGARLARSMRAMLGGYGLAEDEAVHAIRLIGSALLGFITLETAGSFAHSEPPPDASWTRMLDALDATLRGWTRPEPGKEQ
ncbi:TetR/AcrR family transcriptional regulator [Devosia sp.]|uniref:TetR/AcrR family transcriptional regulator n=1 Tax=Devosia sp. TaxID=1871048 RepID=UPI003A930CD6